jgi:hypothetical protein
VAEEARIRHVLGWDAWMRARRNEKAMTEARKRVSNPLLGDDPLGRLLYSMQISREQYDAGIWFRELMGKLARIDNAASMTPKSFLSGLVPSGGRFSLYEEDTPEWIEEQKRRRRRVQGYVMNSQPNNQAVFSVLNWVVREGRDPHPSEIGNLRVGLNAISQARGA